MPSKHASTTAPRRAPNGVVSDKPIPLRLEEEVRRGAVEAADREERTLSGFCRLVYLKGWEEYQRDPSCIAPVRGN